MKISEEMHKSIVKFGLLNFDGKICNDIDIAKLFADCYYDIARYNTTAKEWYIYDGVCWKEDSCGCEVNEIAKKFVKNLWYCLYHTKWKEDNADDIDAIDEIKARRKKIEEEQKAVKAYNRSQKRKSLLDDARSVYPFKTENLDADSWILNTKNFTLNLRTGECQPHNSDDLLSKVADVEYDPTADCPRFKSFLQEIFSVPCEDGYETKRETIDFVQQILGYTLTGSVTEDCLFLAYGATTRNGKTTLMECILSVMGDYGCTTKPDTLAYVGKPNSGGASEDVARLKGKRFVSISEPQKSLHLDAAKVKDMTGGGKQVARYLHQNSFEFFPEFKLFIDTNYLPRVTDDTLFSSGRIHVIPFLRHFEEDERDRDLSEKLAQEKSGILNWILEGLEKYRKVGRLIPPDTVLEATKEYQEESDKIGQFFAERMEKSEKNTKGVDVYKAFCNWCEESNLHAQSKGTFFDDLRRRGIMYPCKVNGMQDRNGVKGWSIIVNNDDWRNLTDEDVPIERWR